MTTCVTDQGYKDAEAERLNALKYVTIAKQVFLAVTALQALATAISSYRKLNDISDETLRLEEDEYNFQKRFYWPAEDQFFKEFSVAEPWEGQALLARRYAGRLWPPLASQFATKFAELRCSKPRYCGTSYLRAYQELEVARASTKTNVESLANQLAFAEIQMINERNFDRRKAAYGIYKGIISQAASLYSAAGAGFSGVGASALGDLNNRLSALMFTNQRQAADQYRFQSMVASQFAAEPASSNNYTQSGSTTGSNSYAQSAVAEASAADATAATNITKVTAFHGATTSQSNGYGAQQRLGNALSQNTMVAGTGQDLSRGGKIEVTIPSKTFPVQGGDGGTVDVNGLKFTIDLDKADLVDVSGYRTDLEQVGPEKLPAGKDGDVEYKESDIEKTTTSASGQTTP